MHSIEPPENTSPSSSLSDPILDRWLMADGPTKRTYIVHTLAPRFIAEIIDRRTINYDLDLVVGLDKNFALVNFNWFDQQPSGDQLNDLLRDATGAVLEDDAITVAILDSFAQSNSKDLSSDKKEELN